MFLIQNYLQMIWIDSHSFATVLFHCLIIGEFTFDSKLGNLKDRE